VKKIPLVFFVKNALKNLLINIKDIIINIKLMQVDVAIVEIQILGNKKIRKKINK
jgi:hypothetical protein